MRRFRYDRCRSLGPLFDHPVGAGEQRRPYGAEVRIGQTGPDARKAFSIIFAASDHQRNREAQRVEMLSGVKKFDFKFTLTNH